MLQTSPLDGDVFSFELTLAQQTQLELMARKTIRTLEQISNKSPRGVAIFQKFDVE